MMEKPPSALRSDKLARVITIETRVLDHQANPS